MNDICLNEYSSDGPGHGRGSFFYGNSGTGYGTSDEGRGNGIYDYYAAFPDRGVIA